MSSLPIPNLPPRPLGPRRGILETRRRQILLNESSKLEEEDQRLQERLDSLRQHLDQQKQRFNAMQGSSFWKSGGKHTSLSNHAQRVLEEKHTMLKKYNLDEKLEAFLPPPSPSPSLPPSCSSSSSSLSKSNQKGLRPVGSATTRKTWNVPLHGSSYSSSSSACASSLTERSFSTNPSSKRFQLPFTELGLPSLQSKHITANVLNATTSDFFPNLTHEKETKEEDDLIPWSFSSGHDGQVPWEPQGQRTKETKENEGSNAKDHHVEEPPISNDEEVHDLDAFHVAKLHPWKETFHPTMSMRPILDSLGTNNGNELGKSLPKASSCLELGSSQPSPSVRPSTCSTSVQVTLSGIYRNENEKQETRSWKVSPDFKLEFTKQLSLLDQWLLRELKKAPPPPSSPPSSSSFLNTTITTTTTNLADLSLSTCESKIT